MIARLEASVHLIEPEMQPCRICAGRGWVVVTIREMDGRDYDVTRDCRRCGGTGQLLRDGMPTPAKGCRPEEWGLGAAQDYPRQPHYGMGRKERQ